MPVDGATLASIFQRFVDFAEGTSPYELTSVATHAVTPFLIQEMLFDTDATKAGAVADGTMVIRTSTALVLQTHYTYDGATWNVTVCERTGIAGSDWSWQYTLVRQAT